ncbi:MAG TPA: asparagine synthase-related protein, partial [Streptosporangiaceae bacterium]
MCGIALIAGDGADQAGLTTMLAALRPRGEVTETASGPRLAAGTQRLRIVDRDRAVQPWASAGGHWLLCLNGEIYNHRELRAELTELGRVFRTGSDTEVVAEAFAQWGEHAVARLRGEFAFAIGERDSGRVYLARDLVGVKPLYWSARHGLLRVASEIKALVPAGAPVREVPPGCHGWAEPGGQPRLRHYSSLLDPDRAAGPDAAGAGELDDAAEAAALIRQALADSIAVRLDTDLPVGVILSGGLDSTLTLLHVRQRHPGCVAFTVGTPDSEDVRYARRLTGDLGVRHEVVELAPRQIRLDQIREAIRISELTEYGDIINAVVSVPLFRRIAECGIKVVLTGDGSDELFGGYPMYEQVGPAQARRLFLHKIANLGRTELQRVDRTSMASGVEARVPFLDPAMVAVALRLPMSLKVRDGAEKWILRQAFADMLPGYIKTRHKNPMSHASGLHERARLYKPAFARVHRSFGYDLHEPVRRDFSILLEQCGNDLDLAVAQASARLDYSAREHVRDLAGAAR